MPYFDESCDFIAQAIGSKESEKKDGKILVHCREGVSRSATLVLAYLIKYQDMSLKDALTHVRSKRDLTKCWISEAIDTVFYQVWQVLLIEQNNMTSKLALDN